MAYREKHASEVFLIVAVLIFLLTLYSMYRIIPNRAIKIVPVEHVVQPGINEN